MQRELSFSSQPLDSDQLYSCALNNNDQKQRRTRQQRDKGKIMDYSPLDIGTNTATIIEYNTYSIQESDQFDQKSESSRITLLSEGENPTNTVVNNFGKGRGGGGGLTQQSDKSTASFTTYNENRSFILRKTSNERARQTSKNKIPKSIQNISCKSKNYRKLEAKQANVSQQNVVVSENVSQMKKHNFKMQKESQNKSIEKQLIGKQSEKSIQNVQNSSQQQIKQNRYIVFNQQLKQRQQKENKEQVYDNEASVVENTSQQKSLVHSKSFVSNTQSKKIFTNKTNNFKGQASPNHNATSKGQDLQQKSQLEKKSVSRLNNHILIKEKVPIASNSKGNYLNKTLNLYNTRGVSKSNTKRNIAAAGTKETRNKLKEETPITLFKTVDPYSDLCDQKRDAVEVVSINSYQKESSLLRTRSQQKLGQRKESKNSNNNAPCLAAYGYQNPFLKVSKTRQCLLDSSQLEQSQDNISSAKAKQVKSKYNNQANQRDFSLNKNGCNKIKLKQEQYQSYQTQNHRYKSPPQNKSFEKKEIKSISPLKLNSQQTQKVKIPRLQMQKLQIHQESPENISIKLKEEQSQLQQKFKNMMIDLTDDDQLFDQIEEPNQLAVIQQQQKDSSPALMYPKTREEYLNFDIENIWKEMEEIGRSKKAAQDLFLNFQEKFYDKKDQNLFDATKCSPTKRLIQMKNTTTKHHQIEQNKGLNEDGTYQLSYTTSPDKSYLVKPDSGEIKYEQYKNKETANLIQNIISGKVEQIKIVEDSNNCSPLRRSFQLDVSPVRISTQHCTRGTLNEREEFSKQLSFGQNLADQIEIRISQLENKEICEYNSDSNKALMQQQRKEMEMSQSLRQVEETLDGMVTDEYVGSEDDEDQCCQQEGGEEELQQQQIVEEQDNYKLLFAKQLAKRLKK